MFCKHCGVPLEDTVQTCPNCGTDLTDVLEAAEPVSEIVEITPEEVVEVAAEVVPEPVPAAAPVAPTVELPPQNRPLSGWAYFGLKLLFAAPIVGFVFLIVFSFSRGNINRRNFARSYWCGLLVALIILAVIAVIAFGIGLTFRAPVYKTYSYY